MKKQYSFLLFAILTTFFLNAQATWNTNGNAGTEFNGSFLGTMDNEPLIFKTNNTEKARFSSNGYLGIGTDNPKNELHIHNGAIRLTSAQKTLPGNNNRANGGPQIIFGDAFEDANKLPNHGQWSIEYVGSETQTSKNGGLNFSANFFVPNTGNVIFPGAENYTNFALFLDNNSNIGIGTSNPTTKLQINSFQKDKSGLRLEKLTSVTPSTKNAKPIGVDAEGNVVTVDAGYNANVWFLTGNANTNSDINFFGTTDEQDLVFRTNNIEKARIKTDGKILIGTTNSNCANCAGYKLFVKEGIRTEKVKVDIASVNAWSDYVFDYQYKLKSLDEVEKYIKENKHLPNIPSADEMVAKGLDLGEINAKLLEKIEELTLHSIELNKRNQKLEQ